MDGTGDLVTEKDGIALVSVYSACKDFAPTVGLLGMADRQPRRTRSAEGSGQVVNVTGESES